MLCQLSYTHHEKAGKLLNRIELGKDYFAPRREMHWLPGFDRE